MGHTLQHKMKSLLSKITTKTMIPLLALSLSTTEPAKAQASLLKELAKKYALFEKGRNIVNDIFSTGSLVNGKLLDAIKEVESNNDWLAIGEDGERGAYQITKKIWDKYSVLPFELAFYEPAAREVARAYLKDIEEHYEDNCADWKKYSKETKRKLIAAGYNSGEINVSDLECDLSNLTRKVQNYAGDVIDAMD